MDEVFTNDPDQRAEVLCFEDFAKQLRPDRGSGLVSLKQETTAFAFVFGFVTYKKVYFSCIDIGISLYVQ